MTGDHYEIFGQHLHITSPQPGLSRRLRRRLRPYRRAMSVSVNSMSIDFRCIERSEANVARRPPGHSRTVYEPLRGWVRYVDEADELWLGSAGVQARCRIGPGHVDVSVTPSALDPWLLSHPFLTLPLMEMLRARGFMPVHAAGVVRSGCTVLLPAGSGAGKTTLAIALVRAGFDFMSDDLMFLDNSVAGPRIFGLADEVDVTTNTIAMVPELRPLREHPQPVGWPKRSFRIEDVFPCRVVPSSQPGILLFPTVGSRTASRIVPMSRDEALAHLATNVLLTDVTRVRAHMAALGALVDASGCWRIETGSDLGGAVEAVAELVDAHAASQAAGT